MNKPRLHSCASSPKITAVPEKVPLQVAGEEAAGRRPDEHQRPQSGQEDQQGTGTDSVSNQHLTKISSFLYSILKGGN